MKVLNFSVIEVLPNLLNKSKVQTIRPAFKNFRQGRATKGIHYTWYDKPSRFKVGDKVRIMWKQRSKYESFCTICGEPTGVVENGITENCKHKSYGFYKQMGTVEITEVFKIEMGYTKRKEKYIDDETGRWFVDMLDKFKDKVPKPNAGVELFRRDGFKSAHEMFKVIDKMYDLSSQKEFYVYRWKWS